MTTLQRNKHITIAILPFQVISNEERINSFFVGFTEDLINNFSKFIGLSVISHISTFRIKDFTDQNTIDQLGADFLITGRVKHVNDILKISIQLIKSEDKSIVFADQHNETLNSLLEFQDTIINQIVTVLQEKINYNILSHSYKKNAVDLAAYENYLIGMSILKKGSGDNDKKARTFFNAALKIDPNFSLAYSGLSLSYFNFWSCLLWNRWDENMKGAHKYAQKALEIDSTDYIALGILGRTYVYSGEFEQAEHCLRKSLRMNSNDAAHLLRVSFSLMFLGYANEAVSLYLKAIEINPFHKDMYFAYGSNFYLEIGDFKTSISLSKKVPLDCWTDFPAWVAAAYLQLKDYDNLWKHWNIYLQQFKVEAYTGNEELEKEALDWLIVLNPFKGDSYLNPLCNYIKQEKNVNHNIKVEDVKTDTSSFLLKGSAWEMRYKNQTIVINDVKGFHDIHKLLSHPTENFHCLDLMNTGLNEQNLTESIDKKAKSEYLKRIKKLQTDIEDAEEMNNSSRVNKLQEEYDAILNHLSQSLGLGGKTRKIGSSVEKARSAITWRIRSAIKKIKPLHPELAKHLSISIKTGTNCSYNPEFSNNWIL